jgi:hypothetical protein
MWTILETISSRDGLGRDQPRGSAGRTGIHSDGRKAVEVPSLVGAEE